MRDIQISIAVTFGLVALAVWMSPSAASFWRITALFGLSVVFLAGLRVITGLSRLVSLAHFTTIGVGAYLAAIVSRELGMFGVTAAVVAVLGASLASMTIGVLSTRADEHYYAFVTLAASEMLTNLFRGLSITGGTNGLAGLPAAQLLGWSFVGPERYVWLCLAGGGAALGVAWRYERSSFGVALKAAGDEGRRVESLGIREAPLRLVSFAVGGALAGLGGALFAAADRFVGPESFGASHSIVLLCLLVIGGGLTSLRGVIFAAMLASFGLEALRPLGAWQMVVVAGVAFVLLMRGQRQQ